MVPMRDGVRLETHVFLPPGAARAPALLLRSPYAHTRDVPISIFRRFNEDGIAFLYQSVRGTGGSEGELRPRAQEFDDGQDAVRWLAAQEWSDGVVGTIGASYEGFAAIAAEVDTPEVALVIADGH
jgi:uncharacterized protein